MAFPTAVNDQITDSVTQAFTTGGDDALNVIAELMAEIAKGLENAKQGYATIDELSDAFENAEVAMHGIVAKLATGRD
ncbi:MAG: hypothetical protein B6D77_05075 [gamma proteobacterium symbiont of Ctena orbiculata]|uniref:hypothetical protein n=1 Tax=Candidatus Thiodiazotropha sp. CDECU1 TaxID=3065865 RepID=UPI000D575478|nr:hypothetical protein [Candidatus Thiodiazotropha sp. CDECU1]PVV12838.1 MAG: hypothetical protein B6D77_05075 [gamma proteobacterium symbiont of Ctena orbiculata]PVV21298.1 MAG: hypothetical protein B6D78_08070 [gamma proteobacterium symbiont of Ctena orbiculata]PVV27576.1 MAG: hypothetical protein B6D79_01710 [gamma proteobacterium symbiont of Ctena orbiculata]